MASKINPHNNTINSLRKYVVYFPCFIVSQVVVATRLPNVFINISNPININTTVIINLNILFLFPY